MMWAAQLRNYRPQKEKNCQKGTTSGCGSDTDTGNAGGFSLYSPGAEEAGGKDLDKCAQLLSEMMQAAPGLITRPLADTKGSKIQAGKVKKAVKPGILTKSRKVAERGPKSAVTRKPASKVSAKSREHAIDSVSETSTELQVRLTGPKPLPLNNSETVVRVTGIQPDTGPHFQPGQVVMTKVPSNVPYNNRILSSTPMSSPSAARHRPAAYSLHSDSGTSVPKATHAPHQPATRTSNQVWEAATGKTSAGIQQQEPHNRSGGRGGEGVVNTELIDMMKQYVTQSDDNLTSFIQNCLSHVTSGGAHGQGHHQGQGQTQGQSGGQTGQSQFASSASYMGSQTPGLNTGGSHGALRSDYVSESASRLQNLQANTFMNSAPSGLYMPQMSQPDPASDVDIDAILKTHGVELSRSQSATETKAAAWTGSGQSAELGKENLPPQFDSGVLGNTTRVDPVYTEGESTEGQLHTDHPEGEEVTATQHHHRDNTKPRASHRTKSPTTKTGKKEKDRTKKKVIHTAKEKPSPADTKTQVRTLLYLFGELRGVTSLSPDREVGRLLTDMEQTLTQLTPGLATSSLGTDIDLALQPLRSENAQLRRRMRILNQQFKDKCYAVDEACKPDPSVQVIELELQKHALDTQLQEEVVERERLQAAVTTLAQQIQGLMKERQNMLKVISAKDTDNVRSQQDWISEASGLRAQLQGAEKQRTDLRTQLEEVSQEKLLLDITLKQRTKENDRLRELVKSLQASMSRLLEDLKGTKPRQSVDDISRYIESIGNLLKTDPSAETLLDTRPTRDTVPPTFTPSVPPVSVPPPGSLFSSLLGNAPPFVGQLQDLIRSLPAPTNDPIDDEVQEGLQRAYQLLDRIDDAITPRPAKSPERKTESRPLTKSQGGPREQKRPRSKDRASEASPQRRRDYPQPYRHEKADSRRNTPVKVHLKGSPVDFDPDNDNYQGQLTQELLQEHDRQNGVDNEVIERMLVHGTRSQDQGGQKQSQFSQKPTTLSSMGLSKKSMFTLPKDMDDDPSSLEEHEIRLSFDKLPTVPTSDSDCEKRSGFTSLNSPYDMDTTEYLNPPAEMKKRGSVLRHQQNADRQSASGPTVRELLGPLAERIMHSPAAKRVPSYTPHKVVSSPASSNLSEGTLSSDTDLQGGEGDSDGDDTLTLEDDDIKKIHNDRHDLSMNNSESRYSVSDYFTKYPVRLPPATASMLTTDRSASLAPPAGLSVISKGAENHRDNSNSSPQVVPDMINSGSTSFTTVTSVGSASPTRPTPPGASQHSPQDRLYRGTELDTSLSTIQEAETNSVLSSSSVTSVSSLATVDEQDFKDGLAKLDENIARIQSSLKTQIGGYF